MSSRFLTIFEIGTLWEKLSFETLAERWVSETLMEAGSYAAVLLIGLKTHASWFSS